MADERLTENTDKQEAEEELQKEDTINALQVTMVKINFFNNRQSMR